MNREPAGVDVSRRRFLQGMGGLAAAGALGSAAWPLGPGARPSFAGPVASSGPTVDHIVVLMMENRSFDSVFGWLYDPANAPPFHEVPAGQSFDGLTGKVLSNPVPGGGFASPGHETVLTNPNPDPGEDFEHVFAQLFHPATLPDADPNRADPPGMQGFVTNYADLIADYNRRHPSRPLGTDPRIVMNAFGPDTLPVLSNLANGYAVCDRWFSSIPTQTFTNRSFVHAGTSSGYVDNKWATGVFTNRTPTIFNLLENAAVPWRIYYGGSLLLCNAFLTQSAIRKFATNDPGTNRFSHMSQFFADAAGGLPSYTFIEPNYLTSSTYGPQNDGHPPFNPLDRADPSNLLRAEALIANVYDALRNSPNWDRTLFIITFDEHGGTYDHVPPPATISPDGRVIPRSAPGGSDFAFGRLGVRVPSILVSPLVAQGSVINTVFDHTSVLKSVINTFQLKDELGQPATLLEREKAANDVRDALTLSTPRTDTVSLPVAAIPPDGNPEWPLSDFQRDLVAAAVALLQQHCYDVPDAAGIATTEQATQVLEAQVDAVRASPLLDDVAAEACAAPAIPAEPTFTG